MDEDTLLQLDDIDKCLRDIVHAIKRPEHILLDLESTLFGTYGKQKEEGLYKATKEDQISYAVTYGEFLYQAGSWEYPRGVVYKIGKPYGQLTHMYTFIVTNMDMAPYQILQFYYGCGKIENFIKESKNRFDFATVSSHSKVVNANRMRLHMLAYNLFNWVRRLVLPANMRKQ